MRNDLATDHSNERYVVEVDGIAKAEYPIFVKALRASLQLKQELPNCRVKLRDAGTKPPTNVVVDRQCLNESRDGGGFARVTDNSPASSHQFGNGNKTVDWVTCGDSKSLFCCPWEAAPPWRKGWALAEGM
jgi:hypothetical protein